MQCAPVPLNKYSTLTLPSPGRSRVEQLRCARGGREGERWREHARGLQVWSQGRTKLTFFREAIV